MAGFKGKRNQAAEEELNLVPIMNLVSILIPFLLMAAQFVHLAVIDSTLPAIGEPKEVEEKDPDDKPPLVLTLAVTDRGYFVSGADSILNPEGDEEDEGGGDDEGEEREPTIPCKGSVCKSADSYNYEELTRLLGQVKDEYPDDQNVILLPEARVQYEVIVMTMDASREDRKTKNNDGTYRELFPFVVIAGGAK
jgi:biopolymer transport protein ExbD